MIQFVIGAILGVAGVKVLEKKMKENEKIRVEIETLISEISSIYSKGVNFFDNNELINVSFKRVKKLIKNDVTEEEYERDYKTLIKSYKIIGGFKGLKLIFKLYISILMK